MAKILQEEIRNGHTSHEFPSACLPMEGYRSKSLQQSSAWNQRDPPTIGLNACLLRLEDYFVLDRHQCNNSDVFHQELGKLTEVL